MTSANLSGVSLIPSAVFFVAEIFYPRRKPEKLVLSEHIEIISQLSHIFYGYATAAPILVIRILSRRGE